MGHIESPGGNGGIGVGDGCPKWGGLTKPLWYGAGGGAVGKGTGGGVTGLLLIGVNGGGRIFCNRILWGLGGPWGGLGKGSCDGEPVSF